jgi:hypothetical protein
LQTEDPKMYATLAKEDAKVNNKALFLSLVNLRRD